MSIRKLACGIVCLAAMSAVVDAQADYTEGSDPSVYDVR